VVDRLSELDLPDVPYTGGEAPIDKERFVNARAEDYWTFRERFEQGEIDIDPDDDKLAAQLGSIKGVSTPVVASRSNRKTICASEDCRHRIELTRWPSPLLAGRMLRRWMSRVMPAKSVTGDLMTKAW